METHSTQNDLLAEKKGIFAAPVVAENEKMGTEEKETEHQEKSMRRHLEETDLESHALLQELYDKETELFEYQKREEKRILHEEAWQPMPSFDAELISKFDQESTN